MAKAEGARSVADSLPRSKKQIAQMPNEERYATYLASIGLEEPEPEPADPYWL